MDKKAFMYSLISGGIAVSIFIIYLIVTDRIAFLWVNGLLPILIVIAIFAVPAVLVYFITCKVVCGVCGNKIGLNRYKIKKDNAWCCPDCLKKAQYGANGKRIVNCMSVTISELKVLVADPKAKGQEAQFENIKVKEYRNQCNVCGHIYCYTEGDLMRNQNNALKATIGSVGSVASALGGSRIDMYAQGAMADRAKNAVIDYSRCPNCNSTDIKELSEEEFKTLKASPDNTSDLVVSNADEIKKFKELLDSGIITQEEFDAKKKQLLGL